MPKKSNRGGARPNTGPKKKTAAELYLSGAHRGRVEARILEEHPIVQKLAAPVVPQLDAYIAEVALARKTFFDRMNPERTLCLNLDGTEFTWPAQHPLTIMRSYAERSISGDNVAGELVKKVCEKFLRNIDSGYRRELFIDPVEIANIAKWFSDFGAFNLLPWELFVLGWIMGSKNSRGWRIVREAWIEVAKKSGKTALMGGLGLFLICADQELYAEIYAIAVKAEQARLSFRAGLRMRDSNPELIARIKAFQSALVFDGSTFQFVSSESKSADGPNVAALFVDECHEHSDDALYTKYVQGMIARHQPLVLCSTTAGNNPDCWAFQRHEYFRNWSLGVFEDDSKFAFIASIDDGDDPLDEKVWLKSSVSLGVTVQTENLQAMKKEIRDYPALLPNFTRYQSNRWGGPQEGHTFEPNVVAACRGRQSSLTPWEEREWFLEKFSDERCFGGWDCAEGMGDFACFVLLFPNIDLGDGSKPKWVSVPWFFIASEGIEKRERRFRIPLQHWIDQKWITALPGNLITPEEIKPYLVELFNKYRVRDCGYDRWGTKTMMASLTAEHIAQTTEVPQNASFLTVPSKEFKDAVLSQSFAHLDNPVARWMMLSVSMEIDERTSSMMPRKANQDANKKIDFVQATVTSWQRAIADENRVSTWNGQIKYLEDL